MGVTPNPEFDDAWPAVLPLYGQQNFCGSGILETPAGRILVFIKT